MLLDTTALVSLSTLRPPDATSVRLSVHAGRLRWRDDEVDADSSATGGDVFDSQERFWIFQNPAWIDAITLIDDASGPATCWATFYA